MPIKKKLQEAILKLKSNKTITSPALDAEVLLCFSLKETKEYLYTNPKKKLSIAQSTKFNALINQRLKGVPVAYLTGNKDFYNLNFKVNKHTLIPRPETELIIDEVKKITTNDPTSIIDIGTGSGCIIITLAKNLNSKNTNYFATDLSPKAIQIAKINSLNHETSTSIQFLQGNLLEPILNSSLPNLHTNLLITANLPYLTPLQVKNAPSIQYEPKSALESGEDGLNHYKPLLKQTKKLIEAKNPASTTFLLEIDPSQSKTLTKLIKTTFPKNLTEIKKDLQGQNRLIISTIKNL